MTTPPPTLIDALAGRYQLEDAIGAGATAVVYRATDLRHDRIVAIKVMQGDPGDALGGRRFQREVEAVSGLVHPHIVPLLDAGTAGHVTWHVTPYLETGSLRARLAREPRLPLPDALRLAREVGQALGHAHARGVVHRDVKPENILLGPDGAACLTDFGLAQLDQRSRLTEEGTVLGTPSYLAPEQALGGTVDARSDLYALACVLYETLAGRPPFEGASTLAVISQHLSAPPVSPRWARPDTPPALEALVLRGLAKDPAGRFASADAWCAAVDEAARDAAADGPRAGRLEGLRRSRFAGRQRELDTLRRAIDHALGGRAGAVFVSGEPGIGKTRLCEEAATWARLRGAVVGWGHAEDREGPPYGVIGEALRAAGDALGALPGIAAQWPEVARALPGLGEAQAGIALGHGDARARLFDQVTSLVAAWSERAPLVLALDDLHWADAGSLDLALHLLRASQGRRLLLLGTFRALELAGGHPLGTLLAAVNRERLGERLALERLGPEGVTEMVAAAFDAGVAARLDRTLHARTDGNPYFVEELLRDLLEAGAIARGSEGWAVSDSSPSGIPGSVRDAVGRRLARLSEGSRGLLGTAAVIGREFELEVLRQAAGLEDDALDAALDEVLDAQLVREAPGAPRPTLAFEHALVHETLYGELRVHRRAQAHRRVGEAYERVFEGRLDGVLDALAHQFARAGEGQLVKAFDYHLRAAAHAMQVYAHEVAAQRLTAARELAHAAGDRVREREACERLADVHMRTADGPAAMAALQAALDLTGSDDPVEHERLELKWVEASTTYGGAHPDALATARRLAAAPLPEHAPIEAVRRRSRLLACLGQLEMREGRFDPALAAATEAVALAEQTGEPATLSFGYDVKGFVHWHRGEFDDSFAMITRRLERCARPDDLVELLRIRSDMCDVLALAGRFEEALEHAQACLALARKVQSPATIGNSLYNLAWVDSVLGRWREAVAIADEALALATRTNFGATNVLMLHLWAGRSSLWLGDRARAEAYARGAAAMPPPGGTHMRREYVEAELALALGALEAMPPLLARMDADPPSCAQCQDLYRITRARHFVATGHPDEAERELAPLLGPGLRGRLMFVGEALQVQGAARLARGDWPGAVATLGEARDLLARMHNVGWWALALEGLAAAHAALGNEDMAREARAEAAALRTAHRA